MACKLICARAPAQALPWLVPTSMKVSAPPMISSASVLATWPSALQVGLDVLLHGERDTRMPDALAQRLLVDLRIAACGPEQDKTARCVGGGPLVVIRSRAPRCQL